MKKNGEFQKIGYSFMKKNDHRRRKKKNLARAIISILIVAVFVLVLSYLLNREAFLSRLEDEKLIAEELGEKGRKEIEEELKAKEDLIENSKNNIIEKEDEAVENIEPMDLIKAQMQFFKKTEGTAELEIEYREKYNRDFRDDFLFPSDKELISKEIVEQMSKDEALLVRNEIFARNGYNFISGPLGRYFSLKNWYKIKPYENVVLNEIEKANVDAIYSYEKSNGW